MIMFYNRDIYRGKSKAAPMVVQDELPTNALNLDVDLKNLLDRLPQRTPENREVAFWMDTVAQSFAYITINTIMGKGFKVASENIVGQNKIRAFNQKINVNGQTIEDYITDFWLDNIIHGRSVWRISKNSKGLDGVKMDVDLQRVPPETLRIVRDQINGWRAFVQTTIPYRTFKSPEDFLKGVVDTMPTRNSMNTIVIPDDPRIVVYGSLFKKPPMDGVLPFITIKYWIVGFIRKFAEKMWAPLVTAHVGSQWNYPPSEPKMAEALTATLSILQKLKNFSSAAFPGNTELKVHDLKGNGQTYIDFMDKMDSQIMFGLYSSIAVRESSGVYKSNDLADESNVRFMEGVRDKIERMLKRFYVTNIVPDMEEDDILITWPELRSTGVENLVKLLDIAVRSGIFVDARERRKAFASVLTFLGEVDLTDADVAKLDAEAIKMLAPSEPKTGGQTSNAAKSRVS